MNRLDISTKEDAFRLFDEAVKSLTSSNYILTQKPITDLLKCLMLTPLLRDFINDCCTGVDYRTLLNNAISNEGGFYVFTPPKGNKKIIALVTGILNAFDKGEMSLTTFIKTLFPNASLATSYQLFCDSVISVYYQAFRQSFLFSIDAADQLATAEENPTVASTVLEQVFTLLADLRTVFISDNKLSSEKRCDLVSLVDGLYYSLEKGDRRFIKIAWTGLKLAISGYKKADRRFDSITDVLNLYALL